MADAGIGSKVDKKTVSYVVAGVFCLYALVYKIPIPCFGCQKNGFWYRCVMDTGEGTASCEAHKRVKQRIDSAGRLLDEAGVFMDNLWDFTKTELPGVIRDFIATLKDQILGLKDRMAEKITQIIAFLRDKLALFVSKIKEAVVYTYEKFLEIVVNPVIQFFINNLLQPVVKIFEKIVEFRSLVWKVLANAIEKFANIGIGDFVGDVVDVFQKIPEAMSAVVPFVVKMINLIKNKTIGVVNTGIRESIEGVEKSVNTLSSTLESGVNSSVFGLNKVKDELVNNLNVSINTVTGGIERAVNDTTGAIETVVNSSVGGVTKGVNTSMGQVETGVNTMIDTTNHVVGGAEFAVNKISCDINKAMNKVEGMGNDISKGLTSAIKTVISPIETIKQVVDKVRGTNVGLNKKFANIRVKFDLKPFRGLPRFNAPKAPSQLFKADIPDIPIQTFARIDKKLSIPGVPWDGIKIDDVNIPEVDIKAPKDIPEIDIREVTIPRAEIPIPADVKEEDLEFPDIPGIGFIGDKISQIKASIKSIFEKAMEPMYEGVAVLIALVGGVISSAVHFFENYLTWTAIKSRVSRLVKIAGSGITQLKELFTEEIVPGFIRLIKSMKDPILDFVKTVTDHAWGFLKKLGRTVGNIFNETFRVIVKVTGMVARGAVQTAWYIVGTTIDRYTGWLPLPISVKIVLLCVSIIWMFLGGWLRNGKVVFDVGLLAIRGAATVLTDMDRMLDSAFGIGGKAASAGAAAAAASSFISAPTALY